VGHRRLLVCTALALTLTLSSCGEPSDDLQQVELVPALPLTAAEVDRIVRQAAAAIDAPDLVVVVVDRPGRILAAWERTPAADTGAINAAAAIARTGAFLSSSQGPLSSRTLEYISTFHFPPVFGPPEPTRFPALPPQRVPVGVENTPQGPLWQLFASNRGADFGLPAFPPVTNVAGSPTMVPSTGLGYLPGGFPLYKDGRVVGGVGCYGASFDACEFAAFRATTGFAFPADVPPEGAIFLVGILLPYVEATSRPAGFGAGDPAAGAYHFGPIDGIGDADGWLFGPIADPLGKLSEGDVRTIVGQGIDRAMRTRAAIRLPLGSTTRMIFGVTNLEGEILGVYRMPDAPVFSIDVSITKARTVTYFSSPEIDPRDAIPGIPPGTAITTRTLGFLTQPFYPPGIDSSGREGPIYEIALANQDPESFDRMGHADPALFPYQSGIIFFPGAAPLYQGDELVGGLGVSGDGVEEDDWVTAAAVAGFEPPDGIRADLFEVEGVRLPYFKFPQNPGQ
jgi:uncharacterized protein GlcG (DUF336 family)